MAFHFCLNLPKYAHLQGLCNAKECIQVHLLLLAYVDKLTIMFYISFTIVSTLRGWFVKLRDWFVLLKCFPQEEQRQITQTLGLV